MGIINKPHDKFFKETFSDIETTKDFMVNYLPQEILRIIDLESLTIEKDSYIDRELDELFSDMLFKTCINDREGYIYFLFEHKSYLSKQTALQLLKYMIKIWDQKSNKESSMKLPVIIPLVVYHGENKWNIESNLIAMIDGVEDLTEEVKRYIPNYEYILYDLSPYGDEEIKGDAKLRIFLEILNAIFHKNPDVLLEVLTRSIIALEKLEHQEKGIDYFKTFIKYIINVRNDIAITDVYTIAKDISLERSEEVMTIAEQLIKEGMEKGMEKGIEKGVLKGKIKTASNLFSLGLTLEQIAQAVDLSIEQVTQLKKENMN